MNKIHRRRALYVEHNYFFYLCTVTLYMTVTTLLLEAGFVGTTLAIFLAIALHIVKPTSTIHVLALGFGIGATLHLLYEVAGLNKYYCTSGAACKR
jgi:type IV secretory pathway TrbL component